MNLRSVLFFIACATACGSPSSPGSSNMASAACSIAVGAVQPSVGAQTMTGTSLSCTGTVNGAEVNCGTTATLTRVSCSDGYAFIIKGGSETLYVRMQGGAQWSSGAQFEGGDALNGDITFADLLPPSMLPPPAGTQEQASFVLQDTTNGQGVVANGTLQASW